MFCKLPGARSGAGGGNVGADDVPEPPFSRAYVSTKRTSRSDTRGGFEGATFGARAEFETSSNDPGEANEAHAHYLLSSPCEIGPTLLSPDRCSLNNAARWRTCSHSFRWNAASVIAPNQPAT